MKVFFIALLCSSSLVSLAQSSFTIDGYLKGKDAVGKKVVLTKQALGAPAIDSTFIGADGRFQLKGSQATPAMMALILKDVKDKQGLYSPAIPFFAENSKIKIEGNYDSLLNEGAFMAIYYGNLSPSTTIKGSKSHDLYLKFYGTRSQLDKERSDAFNEYVQFLNPGRGKAKRPMQEGIPFTKKIDAADEKRKNFSFKYILANPPSEVLAYIADKSLTKTMTPTEIEQLIAKFEGAKQKGPLTEAFLKKATTAKRTAVGTQLVDFTLSDAEGKQHRLSDYVGKGRYTLVEFWASWCGPCRADIPHLKEAFNAYHPQGFDIVGVSLDEKQDAWVKAMEEEGITNMWPQLIESKAFKSELTATYQISGIPACLLFDPQGRLVTYNMRGSFMDNILIELYGNHFPKKDDAGQTKSGGNSQKTNSSGAVELSSLTKEKEKITAEILPIHNAYNNVIFEISAATKEGKDEATIKALRAKLEGLDKQMDPFRVKYTEVDKQIMKLYPSSTEAAKILITSIGRMPLQEGLAAYEKLSEEAKNSQAGKMIKNDLDRMQAGSPGATAINFTSTELRGEQLSLSDYRGKYVLIDFWASWCVPCRKGNPHLLDIYAKYKNKGFEIIGVASDDGKEDVWKKAVQDDKIGVWKHVLRGYKGQNPDPSDNRLDISRAYGISTLPTKILVDPNGKIIGRYGSGGENDAAMDKKLAEIFGS